MIICMLVIVRDFSYLIAVILKYIHNIVLSLCLTFFMFHILQNVCFLFKNSVSITMFILNFTRLCFMSRISTPMKYSSQVKWSVCSVQVFRHVSSSSLLVSLHLYFYRFMTSLTMSSYFSYFSIVSLKK
jgi:hypothetical protein